VPGLELCRQEENMKKSIALSVVIIVGLALLGACASIDKGRLASLKSAAVVSVYSDRAVDMSDFGSLLTMAKQLANSSDFDLQPIAVRLRDDVFQNYAPLFPFPLMDEGQVLGNPDYQAFQSRQTTSSWSQAMPKDYALVSVIQAKEMKNLAASLGADAAVVLQATYKLAKDEGRDGLFGKARVNCSLWLVVRDAAGKELLSRMDFASSTKWVAYALNFVPNTAALIDMCQESTDLASATMKAWLAKSLK
jgi:hypothetical protein